MSHEEGMLSLDDLRRCVAEGVIDTVDVAFTDHYGRLMGKTYDAGFFLEEVGGGGHHADSPSCTTSLPLLMAGLGIVLICTVNSQPLTILLRIHYNIPKGIA